MFNKCDEIECKERMKNRIRAHVSEDIKPLTCTAQKEKKCRREENKDEKSENRNPRGVRKEKKQSCRVRSGTSINFLGSWTSGRI